MKIDVSRLKWIPGEIEEFTLSGDFQETLDWQGEKINFVEPLQIIGESESFENGRILVKGEISGRINKLCSRCLKPIQHQLNTDFVSEFYPDKGEPSEELSEEFPNQYYAGDFLQLEGLVKEQIYLSMPMQFLCSPQCQGLCPHCGNNLALEPCNCSNEQIDPRFEILKKLIDKDRKED